MTTALRTKLLKKTDEKYLLASSFLPSWYFMAINLPAIAFNANVIRLVYPIILLDNPRNPMALIPNLLITKGLRKKLIRMFAPKATKELIKFMVNCLFFDLSAMNV